VGVILDRFLHHAEIISISGKSYRLRNKAATSSASGDAPEPESESKSAISPAGSDTPSGVTKRSKNKSNVDHGPEDVTCQL
jgi:hypothetical protein